VTWLNKRAIAEIIGVVGVVGSLIFVGLEVRQSSAATRAANNAQVADSFRELNLVLASSPDLSRALVVVGGELDAASPEDKTMALAFLRALFHTWSNAHRQWMNGTLDPALFEGVVSEIETYGKASGTDAEIDVFADRGRSVRWAWENEQYIFNPDFRTFMNELLGADARSD
jgi:tRNA pseudouridine-54 N-methylase